MSTFSPIVTDSPLPLPELAAIGRDIGGLRKAGAPIPLALSLRYLDGAIPLVVAAHLPRGTVHRADVTAAHEKAFGERPDHKSDAAGFDAWNKALDSNVTRLLRAGLMMTADGTIGIPAGRTKNVGARSLGAAGTADSGDVEYLEEKFTKVDAATLVKILGRGWAPEALCDALRAHGYRFEDANDEDDLGVDWKRILDPKPMSAHERARIGEIARITALVDGLVADGDVAEDRRAGAIERRVASWDALHPNPEAPKSAPKSAPKADEIEAPKSAPKADEIEAPKTRPSQREPAAPIAPPEPPVALTTPPPNEKKSAQTKRLAKLADWKAANAPAAP